MVHAVPNNDEREHELTGECWCGPLVEWLDPETDLPFEHGDARVIHYSADCRELGEIDGESVSPEKNWSVIEV